MDSQQQQQVTATAAVPPDMKEDELKVTTIPIVTAIPQGKEEELEVLVQVKAPEKVVERAPIDLVAVLDVSGSMNSLPNKKGKPGKGEQSRLDHLKAAMEFVINNLGERDRLAIVAFNSKVTCNTDLSQISVGCRKSTLESVKKLEAIGGTSFKPALQAAVEKLQKRESEKERAAFILFLSDGEDSQWEPKDSFGEDLGRYPIHTFGFSLFHDPTALQGIAAASSGGTYSFIDQDLGKITEAFGVCLGGLATVVAVDVAIRLSAEPGVAIVGIHSGAYKKNIAKDGASGVISIPVLCAGDTNNFIVRLRVPAYGDGEDQQQLLAVADVGFSDPTGRAPVAEQSRLSVERTAGDDTGGFKHDEVVLKEVVRFKLLSLLQELPEHWDKKDWPDNEEWKQLKKAKATFPGYDDGSLESLWEEDVKMIEAKVVEGKRAKNKMGQAYAWSYVSSRLTERATIMGSPGEVMDNKYMTPDMRKYWEAAKAPQQEKVVEEEEQEELPAATENDKKKVPVLVCVKAPEKSPRAPVDVVVVIDVSNRAFPTRLAMARATALLIRRLGPGDRLAIVPFHGNVVEPTGLLSSMNEAGKSTAEAKVMSLIRTAAGSGGGGAKFLPALKHASDLLSGRRKDEVACRPGFVLFLSDGEDSSVLSPEAEISEDYPVDTVGLLCQGDYRNPASMVHISRHTGGTYHPVDGKSTSGIKFAVGTFLAGILSAVAAGTHVELRVQQDTGVRITKVESGSYSSEVRQDGKSATITVGALYADEKKFIVRLEVPAGEQATKHVLTVRILYNRPAAGKLESVEEEKVIEITRYGGVERPPPPQLTMAGGGGLEQLSYNQLLVVEMVRVQVVRMVTDVVEKLKDDGEDQRKIAEEVKQKWDHYRSSAVGGVLQELWWAAAATAEEEWKQYVEEQHGVAIQSMQASLQQGYAGVYHLHSWVAGQRAQRPTAMAAGAAPVSWFLPPHMQGIADDRPCFCLCSELDWAEQEHDVWSKLGLKLFHDDQAYDAHRLTAVFRQASRGAIKRAVHHIYQAVVNSSVDLRPCDDDDDLPPAKPAHY